MGCYTEEIKRKEGDGTDALGREHEAKSYGKYQEMHRCDSPGAVRTTFSGLAGSTTCMMNAVFTL